MLTVLAAIDTIADATLVKIVARTGIDKKTVTMLVQQAAEQAGVRIEQGGSIYRLIDWGPVLKRAGAKMALTGALNAPIIETCSAHIGSDGMRDIEITKEAPAVVRIPGEKIKVGHVTVFKNNNGTWSLERVREIYKIGDDSISFGTGPVGHARRTALKSDKVVITRESVASVGI